MNLFKYSSFSQPIPKTPKPQNPLVKKIKIKMKIVKIKIIFADRIEGNLFVIL